jgi:hypothetical protein
MRSTTVSGQAGRSKAPGPQGCVGSMATQPTLGDPFALADAHHFGCRVVADFIDQQVRPRIDAAAAADPTLMHLAGILLRVVGWLRTIQKLNEPADFQAAAAGARTIFEISIDLTLLEFDKTQHTFEKLHAWERSAKFRHAAAVARHYDGKPGPLPGEVATMIGFAKRWAPAIEADRVRRWPDKKGKGRHPDRWTGHDLRHDAIEADKLAHRGFVEFYASRYQQICWYVHGSGLTGVANINEEMFPALTLIAFDAIGQFAIVAAEMAVRLAGHWDAQADLAIQSLAKGRKVAIAKVYVGHPARKRPPDAEPRSPPPSGTTADGAPRARGKPKKKRRPPRR